MSCNNLMLVGRLSGVGMPGRKGEPGEQGIKGDKGEKGDKGDKGDKGENGQGITPEVQEKLDEILTINDRKPNIKSATENGVKEFDCIDGYIDNIYMEGETLINLWFKNNLSVNSGVKVVDRGISWTSTNSNFANFYNTNINMFEPSTVYTFIVNVSGLEGNMNVRVHGYTNDIFGGTKEVTNGVHVFQSTSSSDFTGKEYAPRSYIYNPDGLIGKNVNVNIIILKGVKNYQAYFNGLYSIGQGDKIEVLSYQNNNLISDISQNIVPNDKIENGIKAIDLPSFNFYNPFSKDVSLVIFKGGTWSHDIVVGSGVTNIELKQGETFNFINLYFNKGWNLSDIQAIYKFVVFYDKYDKKQILTTLRSLPNGVRDILEGNKKIVKCGEKTLNGTNVTWYMDNGQDNFKVFNCDIDLKKGQTAMSIISNKYKTLSSSGKEEGFLYEYSGNKRIKVTTNKFSNLDDFLDDLKLNPITIIYEINTKIFEYPVFNNITYSPKTTLLLSDGNCNFEYTNSSRNELDVLKKLTSVDNDKNIKNSNDINN